VQAVGQQSQRAPDGAPLHYERHRPEQTTLYRLVQQHAAIFIAHTEANTGAEPPRFIKDEFDAFLAGPGPGARGGAGLKPPEPRRLRRRHHTHHHGLPCQPAGGARDLAARCRKTKGQPSVRGRKRSLPLVAHPMQTANHLQDKLNARSPAPNPVTSGGRSKVLRAHLGVVEGG
jgi:hypothetical protein